MDAVQLALALVEMLPYLISTGVKVEAFVAQVLPVLQRMADGAEPSDDDQSALMASVALLRADLHQGE